MAHATYFYVAKLSSLSGIDPGFLGGDGALSSSNLARDSSVKSPPRSAKAGTMPSAVRNRTHRGRIGRPEEKAASARHSLNGVTKVSTQEVTDRHLGGEELDRIDAQKGGIQQTCLIQSNGVAPGSGDHFARRRTLRTKGQEESREHQP